MTLACTKCESHYLIEDYDARMRMVTGYHCGMCGSTKLIDDSKQSAESSQQLPLTANGLQLTAIPPEVTMSHKLCEVEGCTRMVVKDRRCSNHYKEKYGKAPKKSYKKTCSAYGCQTPVVKEGLCHKHLTARDGHSPYPKGKKVPQKIIKKPPPSAFVEVAPSVLVPKETKVLVDQINAIQSPATTPEDRPGQSLSMISRKETITMKVHGEEGGLLEGRISFTYRNGSPPEFNGAGIEGTQDPLSFDDWMFLAAIANEIKRIQEGV